MRLPRHVRLKNNGVLGNYGKHQAERKASRAERYILSKQNKELRPSLPISSPILRVSRRPEGEAMGAMESQRFDLKDISPDRMRKILDAWPSHQAVHQLCSYAGKVLDGWVGGDCSQWGRALYDRLRSSPRVEEVICLVESVSELTARLREKIQDISTRAFQIDPSGRDGPWKQTQLVLLGVSHAANIVDELLLIGKDGGIPSLEESFRGGLLEFQLGM
ncbi:hypothetical protein BD410DRAFT_847275 [Rickenella mellea]|uniref:Uncharacterized protein n=1 Tax=Rickenella mellea TaxID=50990 RepID=A0A4Y7PD90_9AGAM|nr:hypothetical protein BD410DRAFT_847275 [Rickenella mellea]